MNALVASMIGLGPHEMSGWDWVLATAIMLVSAVLAIAAVYFANKVTPHR